MRVHTIVRLSAVVIGVLGVAAELSLNPLRGSDAQIREWLLKQAPLGSSVEDVKTLIADKKWFGQYEGWGGVDTRQFPLRGIHWLQSRGQYSGLPWTCHARATWGFDDEKLVDVYVEKWCEGM